MHRGGNVNKELLAFANKTRRRLRNPKLPLVLPMKTPPMQLLNVTNPLSLPKKKNLLLHRVSFGCHSQLLELKRFRAIFPFNL